jgi:hypothetical protein
VRKQLLNRLKRLENVTALASEEAAGQGGWPPPGELRLVASETAAAFRVLVESYKRHGMSDQDARAAASASSPKYDDLAMYCPPEQMDWALLHRLAEIDPDLALDRWEEVKQAAGEELSNGMRAMQAVEGHNPSCWQTARFLALRAALRDAWRPRNACEEHLVDQLVQAQVLLWHWQGALRNWGEWVSVGGDPSRKPDEPRVSHVEMMDRAADMVDRMQRLYLRTLKALQDLRRQSPVVVIPLPGRPLPRQATVPGGNCAEAASPPAPPSANGQTGHAANGHVNGRLPEAAFPK